MRVEIEIDEDTAACLWDNHTWDGRDDATIEEVVKRIVEREASLYRVTFPQSVSRTIERFREAFAETIRKENA